jgi:trimeric autotransporter adhesin
MLKKRESAGADWTRASVSRGGGARVLLMAAVQIAIFSAAGPISRAQCAEGWIPNGLPGTNGTVKAMIVWDPDLAGPVSPQLVVAGHFSEFGGVAVNNIATYDLDTGAISGLAGGITVSARSGPTVYALAVDAENGLLAGGDFRLAGGLYVNGIARWNGFAWSAFGQGAGIVNDIAILPDSSIINGEEAIFEESALRRWDGSSWSNFGGFVSPVINSLAILPNGNVIAGGLVRADGEVFTNIAQWNGSTWEALGSGVDTRFVNDLDVMPNGDLIVGGAFQRAGGLLVNGVSRWDGEMWHPFGSGLHFSNGQGAEAEAIEVTANEEVIVGGHFAYAGPIAANNVARWDGLSWAALGTGTDGVTYAMTILPDGDIAVGGDFTSAGGIAAARLARYRLSRWRGDTNCDRVVNNFDVDPFVLAIIDPQAYALEYPDCELLNADINCDGSVDNFDIDPFVLCVIMQGCF